MTIPQVPQIKECYLTFEFPTYDSLPQKTKNIINKIMKTAVDWNTKVINNQVQTYLTTKGRYIPYQDFWLSCTDDSDENIYYYIDLDKYYDDSWDTDHDLMTNEIIDLNLYSYNNSNDEVKEIAPVKIKAFVDGVLTPMAEFRPILSVMQYHDEDTNSDLSGRFYLMIKNSNQEFPDTLDYKHLAEFTKNNHIVLFNIQDAFDNIKNLLLRNIVKYSNQAIEAVYIQQRQNDIYYTNLYKKLEPFTLFVGNDDIVLIDKDGNQIFDPYYVIVNPQNLTIEGESVQLVTGKLIVDASQAVTSPFNDFFHGAIDMCGFYRFFDTSYDSVEGTTINFSFPEHQIHSTNEYIQNEMDNVQYFNFGSIYLLRDYDYPDDELKFAIKNGNIIKSYNIVCIKNIGKYNGYVSESYLDKTDGVFKKLVNYDNNGYGDTCQNEITAWVIPLPEYNPK